jgi:hypothetical protein
MLVEGGEREAVKGGKLCAEAVVAPLEEGSVVGVSGVEPAAAAEEEVTRDAAGNGVRVPDDVYSIFLCPTLSDFFCEFVLRRGRTRTAAPC